MIVMGHRAFTGNSQVCGAMTPREYKPIALCRNLESLPIFRDGQ